MTWKVLSCKKRSYEGELAATLLEGAHDSFTEAGVQHHFTYYLFHLYTGIKRKVTLTHFH